MLLNLREAGDGGVRKGRGWKTESKAGKGGKGRDGDREGEAEMETQRDPRALCVQPLPSPDASPLGKVFQLTDSVLEQDSLRKKVTFVSNLDGLQQGCRSQGLCQVQRTLRRNS